MPIEPVKIPQNVQIEDRLIGFVTMRQVFLCLAGGGISYVIWNLLKSAGFATSGTAIFAWSPLVIAAAFAFIKYQNLTLLRMILLFLERGDKPPLRSFGPRTGISMDVKKYYEIESAEDRQHTSRSFDRDKLHNLSALLDESDTPQHLQKSDAGEDIPEEAKERPTMPVDPNRVSVDKPEAGTRPVDGVNIPQNSTTETNTVTVQKPSPSPSS